MYQKLVKADSRGDGFYYRPEDLEWVIEPSEDDPGVTEPKDGAEQFDGNRVK